MKIFVAHSSGYDFRKELYFPLRRSVLNAVHDIYLPQEEKGMTVTSEFIKLCDVIIAECSYGLKSSSSELEWANMYHVPIVCIAKAGTKLSPDLQNVTKDFIEYTDEKDMIEKLQTYLIAFKKQK